MISNNPARCIAPIAYLPLSLTALESDVASQASGVVGRYANWPIQRAGCSKSSRTPLLAILRLSVAGSGSPSPALARGRGASRWPDEIIGA